MQHVPPTTYPGRRLTEAFVQHSYTFALAPHRPRDLVLRGNHKEATEQLVEWRKEMEQLKALRSSIPNLEQRAMEWCQRANALTLKMNRAEERDQAAFEAAQKEMLNLFRERNNPMLLLLQGASADNVIVEVLYLLALCKHELAELQERRTGHGSPRAVAAWQEAGYWWGRFLLDYPNSLAAPAARRHCAATLLELGQFAESRKQLLDFSGELTDLEKLTRQYLANQLMKK